ncbi:MAG: glycoside hydrolase family 88 protein, partial [Limisphaerales bacterium]
MFETTISILALSIFRSPAQSVLTPTSVLNEMQLVGDWQLAHPVTERPTGWICAAGDIGMMALSGISGDPKYRDAMLAKGDANDWQLPEYRGRKYHADDQCIGQVWSELYFLYRENQMIAPMRAKMDFILANPPADQSLDMIQGKTPQSWSWCDALFMAPPSWLRLYAATGDERYINYALTNFWRTADFLYDKDDHLFFRDSTFFDQREPNGAKVFWSRGNGWVFAGIVRILQYLPNNHPDRPRLEQLFREMAGEILDCQQPDGLWRSSLLDPKDYPMPEVSGSALFTYGLAWGLNQGLLDGNVEPAVWKAWSALVNCVDATGRVTHIQPHGAGPALFPEDSTAPYGAGVFLLAGSEVYRLAVLSPASPVAVRVRNPADFRRDCETVEIPLTGTGAPPAMLRLSDSTKRIAVMDGVSSRILDSQTYFPSTNQEELLFQVDLAPDETRKYYILDASRLPAVPEPIIKTFARFVPERYDDFAWESDRIAYRMYGLALIPAEGTISSGPDVWIKKHRQLIVDLMYKTGRYHYDNGEYMDDYRVGNSRGCGGLGIWDGKRLHVSSNYHHWKLITTGPIRSEFELTYDAWDAGHGRMVAETKRISIDANSWFSKAQSTFTSDEDSPLTIGVGLAERACGTNGVEMISDDRPEGWMSYWQPEDKPKGRIGTAILLPKDAVEAFTNDKPNLPESKIHAQVPQPTHEGAPPIRNLLAITTVHPGAPFEYYFGACWNRSGDFTNADQWAA